MMSIQRPLTPMAAPGQIHVPVRTESNLILDNGGDVICNCFTHEMAARVAELINRDAGLAPYGGGR